MSRPLIVDGERLAIPERCHCGALVEDARYCGAQATSTPGDFLLLANCRCGTTLTQAGVNDASICSGCGHLVIGDWEDPKIVTERAVFCVDCAGKAHDVRSEHTGLASAQAVLEAKAYFAKMMRRAPISAGEVRAIQEG